MKKLIKATESFKKLIDRNSFIFDYASETANEEFNEEVELFWSQLKIFTEDILNIAEDEKAKYEEEFSESLEQTLIWCRKHSSLLVQKYHLQEENKKLKKENTRLQRIERRAIRRWEKENDIG